jgi:type IV pilus assembly protein PilY1
MNLRINALARAGVMVVVLLLACPGIGLAQLQYTEDFTGITSANQWFFYNGACLTAGTNTSTTSPGYIPSCKTIFTTYYNPILSALGKSTSDSFLAGGDLGCLGIAPSSGTCSSTITPDLTPTAGNGNSGGALRFTNAGGSGSAIGQHENGAIVSNFVFPTNQGLQLTFKTVTYHGDNNGGHGADGISFYLLDGCMPIAGGSVPAGCPTNRVYGSSSTFSGIGAWGGSLAYTCSNSNVPYDGLAGAYLGLGIDEWGNFLNGAGGAAGNTLNETGSTINGGDNTASGGGYQPGRIGLRGAGNVAWLGLTNAYGSYTSGSSPYYPASLATSCYINGGTYSGGLCGGNPTDAMMAVKKTCSNGTLYNFSSGGGTVNSSSAKNPTAVGATDLTNSKNTAGILDYTAMANAYKVITAFQIANESATIRGSTNVANSSSNDANPITYQLKITQDGLLSLSFSYNGGTWQPVITGQDVTASNGSLPTYFRFGFAGSTGGSTNIHEVMCFKAAPTETSQSSGGVNVFEDPTIKYGTQLFLAYYLPSNWTGQLTAQTIGFDTTKNAVTISSTINWDARCVLTGVNAATGPCSTGAISMSAEAPGSRTMLTWSGSAGIPLEWSNLTSAQQTALDQGDASATSNRLSFLRGDRTNEISSAGTCPQSPGLACFRKRDSVLGDIVDSSPTWVGPPQTYTKSATWIDKLYPAQTSPESSGQKYTDFQAQRQARLNVVYIGANDGFLHGFRAGSLDVGGNLIDNSSTPNDGHEVLAYMPGAVVQTIHNTSTVELDFANTQYSHNWFVDATPATGDVFYAGVWHTWLIGGLGAGGAAIYALDVTDPSTFSEQNPASTVIGEWTPSTITCVNVSNCGKNLGNTYGTPLIRRFHNGSWGVIFGNGYGSQNNTSAGIFIMLIDPASGNRTFRYLATPSGSAANGIANPASLDVEFDHIVDYVYAGDLQGKIWRFDVTSNDPANWAVSASSPLFTTPGNAPITTGVAVGALHQIILDSLGGPQVDWSQPVRVIVNFGTGRMIPQSLTTNAQYASGPQYVFGIWDWDMKAWNALSAIQAVALTGPQSITMSKLQTETITTVTSGTTTYRTIDHNPVCWVVPEPLDASSLCGSAGSPGTQFGWSMALPGSSEQIIFNPVLSPDGELVVNTFMPAPDSPLSCAAAANSTGFSMAVQPDTGNGLSNDTIGKSGATGGFFTVNTNQGNIQADGLQLNGTGIPWFLSSGQKGDHNATYLITQTASGAAPPIPINDHSIVAGKRLTWIQRR